MEKFIAKSQNVKLPLHMDASKIKLVYFCLRVGAIYWPECLNLENQETGNLQFVNMKGTVNNI